MPVLYVQNLDRIIQILDRLTERNELTIHPNESIIRCDDRSIPRRTINHSFEWNERPKSGSRDTHE